MMTRVGQPVLQLSTPQPIVDEAVMAANIARVQSYMDGHGIAFRPHVKTHKIPQLGDQQLAAGANGINCQKISEAEIFADAGFDDILITFNILGAEKLSALRALNERVRLTVVADNIQTIEGLAGAMSAERPLNVQVECDTGGGRCGVQSPQAAVSLALAIASASGLHFGGLLTYPKANTEPEVEQFFLATKALLASEGLDCPVLSNGGTPSLFNAHLVPSATEHRAGTYIYNDRAMMRAGHCTLQQCAMHILATVVSRPTGDRAILDAGSKTLTSDLMGFSDHGLIVEYPDACIRALSEEHAHVDVSSCATKPAVGEVVRIIPNHTCVVSNLFDEMVFHRDGVVTHIFPVAARGRIW